MTKWLLVGYQIKPGNRNAVATWFAGDKGQDILRRMRAETQVSYVCTYFTMEEIASEPTANDSDAYDLWEAPDLAAFDRLGDSPAYAEFEERFHPLIVDQSWKVVRLERVAVGVDRPSA